MTAPPGGYMTDRGTVASALTRTLASGATLWCGARGVYVRAHDATSTGIANRIAPRTNRDALTLVTRFTFANGVRAPDLERGALSSRIVNGLVW
jgi:hypothetical protein